MTKDPPQYNRFGSVFRRCTETCDRESSCEHNGESDAMCVNPSTEAIGSECGGPALRDSKAKGLCFAGCRDDDDCGGEGRRCQGDVCVNQRGLSRQQRECDTDGGCDGEQDPIDRTTTDAGPQERDAEADAGPQERDAEAEIVRPDVDATTTSNQACRVDGGVGLNCDGCPIDQDECGGQCIAVQYDTENCGGCGISCGDSPCDNGICREPTGWQTAVRLDDQAGGAASNARVTVDATGNYLVTWSQSDGGLASLWGNQYVASLATWTGPTRLAEATYGDALEPRVASGTATSMIAWAMHNGTRVVVHAIQYDWGSGAWSSAIEIPGQTLFNASDVELVMDPTGNAVVTWREASGFFYARFNAGTDSWQDATALASNVGPSDPGPLVMHGHDSGDVTVAWLLQDHSTSASRFSAQAETWSTTESIDSVNPGYSRYLVLAGEPGDRVVAMWIRNEGIWWTRFDSNVGTWEVASLISNGPQGRNYPTSLDLGFDAQGNAFITYEQDRDLSLQYYDVTSDTWEDSRPLPFSFKEGRGVAAGVHATGDAILGYSDSFKVVGATYDSDSDTLSGAERLEYRPGRIGNPDHAVGPDGSAIFVWRMGEGDEAEIWSHHYK